MKIVRASTILAMFAVAGLATGCGKSEPKTEPAKTDPAKTEPAKTEPAKTDPVADDPAKTDPAKEPEKKEPVAETKAPEPAPTEPAPAPAPVSPEPVTTKVLEAGADPKIELVLKPTAGTTQTALMTMTMEMQMNVAGQDVPMKLPPMKMGMSTTVDEVRDGGDVAFTFKVDSADVGEAADVMPQVVEAMKAAIGKVVGMGGKSVIDPHGTVKEASFQLPADAPPEMKQVVDSFQQSLNQMSIPFPAEAIGVGAKWQTTTKLEQQGMKVDQVATYEIVSIEGSVVKLKFSMQHTAPPQAMALPQMPAGMSAKLNEFSGSGMGEATIDLSKVLPTATNAKNTMSMSMSVDQGGQKQDMALKMNLEVVLEGK
ncbi:MAG: hypothetical protein IT385_03595 [Deltaproteobacteria bacterium]|nr:hypothetical protein [Deltaproteobacteria bacterium]